MILIISQEYEPSTEDVIDWIHYLKGKFKRINGNDLIGESYELKLDNNSIAFDSSSTRNANIIWYRRGLSGKDNNFLFNSLTDKENISVNRFLGDEKITLLYNTLHSLDKKWLSNPKIINKIKKVEVLDEARKIGLEIPKTLITNSKEKLLEFYFQNDGIIVKAINEVRNVSIKDSIFSQLTNNVSIEMIKEMNDVFFPSLFQEKLHKKYEIRTFYLDRKLSSMAIFSQNDSQTKVDFRHYNDINPNRTIPFKLPNEIEIKLTLLMDKLKLETGSIDIVRTVDNRYVFLEVNPVGQFGMVSYPCNYPIERDIANYLIHQ